MRKINVNEGNESESDVEITMDTKFTFNIAHGHDKRTQKKISNIVELPTKPLIIFSNHEAPLREIISRMTIQRKTPAEIEQAVITKLASTDKVFVVLATISGKVTGGKGITMIAKTVGGLLHKSPPLVEPLEVNSKWTRILCTSTEDKRVLLGQKIVWIREAKAFVTFMKPRSKPYSTKYIELNRVGHFHHS